MTGNKFQQKREATYQQLVEAGMQCFCEKGYAATTLNDIVERIDHTRGAFYFHFESKEALFFHVLSHRDQLREGWNKIPETYTATNTTLEEILSITYGRLQEMFGDGDTQTVDGWILVLVDFYQQTRQAPEYAERLAHAYRQWVKEVEAFIEVLKERGWLAEHLDAHRAAMQVLSLTEGYAMTSRLFGASNRQTLIEGLVKLLG